MDNIVENNKLIAEFMGFIDNGDENNFLIDPKTNYDVNLSEMKFNNSWDWLMPVVEKIESLGIGKRDYTVRISYDICSIDYTGYKMREETPIIFKMATNQRNKIEAVYNAVIKFIQWYNKTA